MNLETTDAEMWLIKRRSCTLDAVFNDIRGSVEVYVNAANGMLADDEKQTPFEIEDKNYAVGGRRFFVRGWPFGMKNPGDKVTIEFVLEDNKIGIGYPNPPDDRELPNLYVNQRWDAREENRVLYVNEEEQTIEQITQEALDPLFFV